MKYWNTYTFHTKILSDELLFRERSNVLFYFFKKYPNTKDISLWCEWKEDPYYAIFLAGMSTESWFRGHIFKNFYEEILKAFPYQRDGLVWLVDGLFLRETKYAKVQKISDKFELKFYFVYHFWKYLKFKLVMQKRRFWHFFQKMKFLLLDSKTV